MNTTSKQFELEGSGFEGNLQYFEANLQNFKNLSIGTY